MSTKRYMLKDNNHNTFYNSEKIEATYTYINSRLGK